MKKILLALTPVAIVASMAFSVLNDPLTIGAKMPMADTKMKDVSGAMVSMKDAAKKNGVLVMFSCNTCPYVLKNQVRTIQASDFAQKMGVGVIILNSNEAQRGDDDSYDAMKSYAKDQKYNVNYVVDENHKVADAFGANRTPEVFLFDKNLSLVYHGAIDDNPSDADNVGRQHLREAIQELSSGSAITVKESRSVGCTIKRNK
jgi:peroxiredoxin